MRVLQRKASEINVDHGRNIAAGSFAGLVGELLAADDHGAEGKVKLQRLSISPDGALVPALVLPGAAAVPTGAGNAPRGSIIAPRGSTLLQTLPEEDGTSSTKIGSDGKSNAKSGALGAELLDAASNAAGTAGSPRNKKQQRRGMKAAVAAVRAGLRLGAKSEPKVKKNNSSNVKNARARMMDSAESQKEEEQPTSILMGGGKSRRRQSTVTFGADESLKLTRTLQTLEENPAEGGPCW